MMIRLIILLVAALFFGASGGLIFLREAPITPTDPSSWAIWKNEPGSGSGTGPLHGVPGPIAGAGLPFLLGGYGVYWIIKRRRRKGTD